MVQSRGGSVEVNAADDAVDGDNAVIWEVALQHSDQRWRPTGSRPDQDSRLWRAEREAKESHSWSESAADIGAR